jgi:hypothetical protein
MLWWALYRSRMQVARGLMGLSDIERLHWQLTAYQRHLIESLHRKGQSRER